MKVKLILCVWCADGDLFVEKTIESPVCFPGLQIRESEWELQVKSVKLRDGVLEAELDDNDDELERNFPVLRRDRPSKAEVIAEMEQSGFMECEQL